MTAVWLALLVTISGHLIATAQNHGGPGISYAGLPEHWLERLNYYRRAADLPPLTEAPSFSVDLAKHVAYMLLNPDDIFHGETPGRPGYTPEGNRAAAESNLYWYAGPIPPPDPIDTWMESLPHRYGILHHGLQTAGFALACNSQHCGAGLNVLRGLQSGANAMPDGVVYPGPGQGRVSTGIISWQFDWQPTAVLTGAALWDASGKPVAITTHSPKPGDYFNVVAVLPTESLSPGVTYTVEMHATLGGRELSRTWSFTTFIQPAYAVYAPLVIYNH
ncbi:MAG: hypothetical protein IT330_19775 [Anaerolineae bacterium]|nr:hypothetical protein [Anaerolineae bacterium]